MPELKPVLMLTNNRMLASAQGGSMYYLVGADGSSERLPLEKACQIYLQNKSRKGSKPPKVIPKSEDEMPAWKAKLHRSLGLLDGTDPDPYDKLPEYPD